MEELFIVSISEKTMSTTLKELETIQNDLRRDDLFIHSNATKKSKNR